MRSRWASLLVVGIVVLVSSCASARRDAPKPELSGLDKKLSTFVFAEEGRLVSLIVDVRPTRYREEADYVPIEICVANRGLKMLSLTRESFTLRDSAGKSYPCVGPGELLEKYEYLDLDRRLGEVEEIVFNRFGAFRRYPSNFSPTRAAPANPFASTIVRDTIAVPKFGWFTDFLYFPRPETGVLNRRFELWMTAPELPDPVFVKFAVL